MSSNPRACQSAIRRMSWRGRAELWHRAPGVPGHGRRPSLGDYVTVAAIILGPRRMALMFDYRLGEKDLI